MKPSTQRFFVPLCRGTFSTTKACVIAAFFIWGSHPNDAADTFIAYDIPAGVTGNQNIQGVSVGMDFEVSNEIIVTRLGIFDDASDGITDPDTTLVARLWDRSQDPPVQVASAEFSKSSPGDLVGGSRFKALQTPLHLPIGFKGTISGDGWNNTTDRIRNSFGDTANVLWTTHDGNGSVQFVGSSRYGAQGELPATVDTGPAARFACATFEYQTTAPTQPGKPAVTIVGGDQRITLSWAPVSQPAPAVKYLIGRSASPAGPFTQLVEVTGTTYTNSALANGTAYSYTVTAVAANATAGPASDVKTAAAYALPADHYIAYFTPASLVGNQVVGDTALGMDFDVQNPIIIKKLGVFDSASDGFTEPMTARIYNRDTQEVLAQADFSSSDSGELIEGMRFRTLDTPLRLEPGFHGTIEANGFHGTDPNYNSNGKTNSPWTLQDANGSILFVGTSRYGTFPDVFPPSPDGGPAARYAAGTFEYQALAAQVPGIPVVTVKVPFEDGVVTLNWAAVTNPLPATKYQISRAGTNGVFAKIDETAAVEYKDTNVVNGNDYCYMVTAIGAGGQTSSPSGAVCATPAPRKGGIAYIVPTGLAGNQNVGGTTSVGMDFDVALPVKITRLGVFDDGQDGLNATLTAAIFDRSSTAQPVVSLQFTPDSPGELIDGSRFKDLPQPLILAAGFQGSIVSMGQDANERLFNTFGDASQGGLTTFSGGSLVFVGKSRYGSAPNYPGTVDTGPVNRFASATFAFEPILVVVDGRPTLLIERATDKVKVTWSGGGTLQKAATLGGQWQNQTGVNSGDLIPIAPGSAYFRVQR